MENVCQNVTFYGRYRFCPKQCHTNEGEAHYLGLWPLGLLSEVVSLCFGGNIPVRRRLIYMESEFKLNSGTKCEHFVSTANRGQNQSVERHCLGENEQFEIKINVLSVAAVDEKKLKSTYWQLLQLRGRGREN